MKRIAMTAAACVIMLPVSGALTAASGAAQSDPAYHRVRVIHPHRRALDRDAAARQEMLSQEEGNRLSAAQAQAQFLPNPGIRNPDSGPEWNCQHSGCGWEPNGW